MTAGRLFREACMTLPREQLAQAVSVRAHLLGSLSATGTGHGTDAALLAGLLGWTPEECPPGLLCKLADAKAKSCRVELNGKAISAGLANIIHRQVLMIVSPALAF